MPAPALFAAPAQPRTVRVTVEWLGEEGEDEYDVLVVCEGTKLTQPHSIRVRWPSGALEQLGPAISGAVDMLLHGDRTDGPTRAFKAKYELALAMLVAYGA